MFKRLHSFFLLALVAGLLFSACGPAASPLAATPQPATATVEPATPTPAPPTERPAVLWIAPSVPEGLADAAKASNYPLMDRADAATIRLDVSSDGEAASEWVYALVAAFPTVTDGLTWADLQLAWAGHAPVPFAAHPLLMSESTYQAMKGLFGGEAGEGAVRILPDKFVGDALWENRPSLGIVPFEFINNKMKVLEVDGQAPIRKEFEQASYPLKVAFAVQADVAAQLELPALNRDPSKMVTIVMTGVTALVRATAFKMEEKGVNYPAEGIRDWLLNADIAHISNEIPFAVGCPFPNPDQRRLIFCSDPKYIELLEYVGADVIELTGNHFEDWGKEATRYTVDMYKERGLPYFGGGTDLADAQKPALLEVNGMKFAFVGCNPAGPVFAWARSDGWPGAAPCGKDWLAPKEKGTGYEWMVNEIAQLKAEGYIVIATFQYFEYYSPDPRPWQQTDFRMMADAGASVVSGSQGHYAQAMEFRDGSFIHYGLGNLFFDQMGYDNPSSGLRTTNTRREFLDRHVFYDGKLINTELLTAMLYDYAQPRPMTPEERAQFLTEYFDASGWK